MTSAAPRIYLSPPDMSGVERDRLLEAFDSNWIAPVGPDLERFETELGSWCNRPHVVALSSGTAALHLALLLVGAGRGDEIVVPSLTFVATANAVAQSGAAPVFVDSEAASWNLDPALVEEFLAGRAASGTLPRAVLSVDLYGQCADYGRLIEVCATYDVPLVVDAAEALAARRDGQPAGSHGVLAALSFNGNKIITTGGGGALLANDPVLIDRARYLATQARQPAPHYEHTEAGFNYRLSNLLAALGCGQLERLPANLARREQVQQRYVEELASFDGIEMMPVPSGSEPNRWLNVITVDPASSGTSAEALRIAMEAENIEARPAWKPMHLQPLFHGVEMVGGAVSERVFATGLCLPSGSSLTDADLDRIVAVAHQLLR